MTCVACEIECQRFGTHRNGLRRFRCPLCHKTYTEAHKAALKGTIIPLDKIVLVLRLLVEGNSIRSTERISGLDRNTIMKLLVLAGAKCEKLLGRVLVNVPVRDVECDEIWGFVGKKEGHKKASEANDESIGDAYTWQSSAIPSWS
jgi:transposase-like protein